MRIRPAFYGLLLATTTASCAFLLDFDELQAGDGTDGGGATGGAAAIPLGDVASELSKAACQRIQRCRGTLADLTFGDEVCTDFVKKYLEDGLLANVSDLDATKFVYHPEEMAGCLDGFAQAPCDVAFHLPATCSNALEGLVVAGGDCSHSLECPYDHLCQGCPGKCTPAPKAGESCGIGICANGLYCDQSGGQCRKPTPTVGGSCLGGTAPRCALDMTCLGSKKDVTGKCRPNDELFTSQSTCNWVQGPLCQEGFFCALNSDDEITNDSYNGKCTGTAVEKEACTFALTDSCPKGYFCSVAGGIAGFCFPLPQAGKPCTLPGFKALCVQGARCANRDENDPVTEPGVCAGLVRNGQSCAYSEQCYSNLCVDGKCKSGHSCLPPD